MASERKKKMFKRVKCRGQRRVFSQGSLYNYKAALENLASRGSWSPDCPVTVESDSLLCAWKL